MTAHVGSLRAFRAAGIGTAELLLRPERFMRAVLRFRAVRLRFLLIWVVGISSVIDSFEIRLVTQEILGGTPNVAALTWIRIWPMLLIPGLLAGGIAWLFWGWWFRVRLRFCGAAQSRKRSARLVWVHARSVAAVPNFLLLVASSLRYANYGEARVAAPLALTFLVLQAWSIFVGYRGAVACFPVRRTPALWRFLILPLGFNVGIVVVAVTAALATSGLW